MKTLVIVEQQPLAISNPPPWSTKAPILHPSTSLKPITNSKIASRWRLQAEAKGFGSLVPEKRTPKKDNPTTGKKSGNDDDDQIPQVVFDRMVGRIVFSVGVPLGIGLGLLYLFGVVREQHLFDVPVWLPVFTTFITFASSALGIAYGTLSTSWDPDRNGSFLGVEQLEQNWVEMWKEEEEVKKNR